VREGRRAGEQEERNIEHERERDEEGEDGIEDGGRKRETLPHT